MANYDSGTTVQLVKARVPILEVIAPRVKLIRRGESYVGLCPFHTEKTPSFHVDPRRDRYHCFGCNVGGDQIDFIQRLDQLTFPEALTKLAQDFGIKLPRRQHPGSSRTGNASSVISTAALYALMQEVNQYFQQQLAGNSQVQQYLQQRGFSRALTMRYQLGWCPATSVFLATARESNWNNKLLQQCGILLQQAGAASFIRFQQRITIPIATLDGKISGFGARRITGNAAKYINSPESEIFKKRRQLYFAQDFRRNIQKEQQLVVVEGYFDLLGLVQNNIAAVCASLGTALGEEQLQLLWRYHPQPIICFDGDNAGYRACQNLLERSLPLVTSERSLQFCWLPDGYDPDSYAQQFGGAATQQLLKNSASFGATMQQLATPTVEIGSKQEMQATFLQRWLKLIERISDPIYREALLAEWQQVKQKMFSSARATNRSVSKSNYRKGNDKFAAGRSSSSTRDSRKLPANQLQPPNLLTLKLLLAYLIEQPALIAKFAEQLSTIPAPKQYGQLLARMLGASANTDNLDKQGLINYIGSSFASILSEINHFSVSFLSLGAERARGLVPQDQQGATVGATSSTAALASVTDSQSIARNQDNLGPGNTKQNTSSQSSPYPTDFSEQVAELIEGFARLKQQQEVRSLALELVDETTPNQTRLRLSERINWLNKQLN